GTRGLDGTPPSSPAELGWRVRASAVTGRARVRVGRALVRSLGGDEAGEMRAEGWRTRQRPPPDSSPAASPPRAPGARPRPRSLHPTLSPQCDSTPRPAPAVPRSPAACPFDPIQCNRLDLHGDVVDVVVVVHPL